MRNKVLIYRDYGCSNVEPLAEGLNEYFKTRGCETGFTDAAGIIYRDELNSEVLAFFMPGGAGTPYRRKLEVLGNDKIRDYVQKGGIYYGICAGAYYACRHTIFEKDVPGLAILSECGLNLLEGKAIGTLYKELGINPYDKTADSAAVVELTWRDGTQYAAHYQGGPYFEIPDLSEEEILAWYHLDDKKPAIVSRKFGMGKVVVSGVHFENSGETLSKAIHLLKIDALRAREIAKQLTQKEESRRALFNRIMHECHR